MSLEYLGYLRLYPNNTVRTVFLDKSPAVRPLGIGESWMRLWSDCSHTKRKVVATNACGNTQLCAGLRSGIEANLHAVRAIWPQSAGWTEDSGVCVLTWSPGERGRLPNVRTIQSPSSCPPP